MVYMRPSSFGTAQAWAAERLVYWPPTKRVIEQAEKANEEFPRTGRRCATCRTRLSRYNTTDLCWFHNQEAKAMAARPRKRARRV